MLNVPNKILPLIFSSVFLLTVCGSGYSADKSVAPVIVNWIAIPELTDEFDGDELDSIKWFDTNPAWIGRKPAWFSKDNVSVSDGKLNMTARLDTPEDLPDGYHSWSTAAVKSKSLVKYGYFEIKCKPMDSAVVSSFWFYNHEPEEWTEIDVFEIGGGIEGEENKFPMNVHLFYNEDYQGTDEKHYFDGEKWEAPFDFIDDYHVFGLSWDEDFIKWYVDGELVRTLENKHWHQPLYMNFDSEVMLEHRGTPKRKDIPSTYNIEYIRSWKKIYGTRHDTINGIPISVITANEIIDIASQDNRFGSAKNNSYGENLEWNSDWDLTLILLT